MSRMSKQYLFKNHVLTLISVSLNYASYRMSPGLFDVCFSAYDSFDCGFLKRRDRPPIPVFLGFPCGSACKESTCNAGDLGLIPALGRFPGEGKGYPRSYSGLEKSMDYSAGVRK